MEATKIAHDADGKLSIVMVEGRSFVHGSILDREGVRVRQLTQALEEIREKAATMTNGGAWAAGLATLCLGTLPAALGE